MSKTHVTPKTLRIIILGCVVMCIAVLTLFQLRYFVGGPEIMISSQYHEVSQGWIDIVFIVKNTQEVSVQGVPVIPQVDGRVFKRIYLAQGLNSISIKAYDIYGSATVKEIEVYYPHDS